MKEKTKDILKLVGLGLLLCATAGCVVFLATESTSKERESRAESENISMIEQGVTYLLTPNLDFDTNDYYYSDTGTTTYYGDFYNFVNDEHYQRLAITTYEGDFINAYVYNDIDSVPYSIEVCNQNDGWLTDKVLIYKPSESYTSEISLDLLSLYNTSVQDEVTFNFANQINYYAPYNENIGTAYVKSANNVSMIYTLIDNVLFESAGSYYNKITLEYMDAEATYYIENNSVHLWTESGYRHYLFMYYHNTYTGEYTLVNTALRQAYTTSNGGNTYAWITGSQWVSQNYKTIKLLSKSQTVENRLSTLNNALDVPTSYYTSVNTGDIGLGQAFDLFGNAFNSLLGLATIQVIPGITLGLLMFMPFLAGLVVFIIWIVKR